MIRVSLLSTARRSRSALYHAAQPEANASAGRAHYVVPYNLSRPLPRMRLVPTRRTCTWRKRERVSAGAQFAGVNLYAGERRPIMSPFLTQCPGVGTFAYGILERAHPLLLQTDLRCSNALRFARRLAYAKAKPVSGWPEMFCQLMRR